MWIFSYYFWLFDINKNLKISWEHMKIKNIIRRKTFYWNLKIRQQNWLCGTRKTESKKMRTEIIILENSLWYAKTRFSKKNIEKNK